MLTEETTVSRCGLNGLLLLAVILGNSIVSGRALSKTEGNKCATQTETTSRREIPGSMLEADLIRRAP
jgi:hypothetical protein